MKDIKNKIELIIEKSSDKPACKNCKSYKEGACTFGCVNERNGNRYRFANNKITSPEYSCGNFDPVYSFDNSVLESLGDLLQDIKRVNEGVKNLDLLLDGKITENDFVELTK